MAMNPDDANHGSATAVPDADHREHALPCGRTVEAVWTELEAGELSPHTTDCPHCTTARASLTRLMEATRLLIDDPVVPPTGMLDRIMDAVRADLVRASAIPVPAPAGLGGIDVSIPALAAVLRFAVDGIDGIRAQRCRVELDPDQPYTVRVTMSVSLRYSATLPTGRVELLEQARERVRTVLGEQIGLRLAGLDLAIADVWIDR